MRSLINALTKNGCIHENSDAEKLLFMGIPIIYSNVCRSYMIPLSDDLTETQSIVKSIGLDFKIKYLEKCDVSSQDIAKKEADEGAPEGTVIVCGSMKVGRGRFGRKWYAPPGGLWFTTIIRPWRVEKPSLISLMSGVAVAEVLKLLLGIEAGLKWPNDVVVAGRKVAGILAEGVAEGGALKYILLGIGVNVNNKLPEELSEIATTLKSVVGRDVPRATLLAAMLGRLWRLYRMLEEGNYADILRRWKDLSVVLGKYIEVKLVGEEIVKGVAIDIDSVGRLIVATPHRLVAVDAGEVTSLRLSS